MFKDANKNFTIQIGFFFIFFLVAGLTFALEQMKGAGFFTAISIVFLIYALSWGFYPNMISIRKRNIVRMVLFLFSHFFTYFFVGGSKGIVSLCDLNNFMESIETISKTYSTLEAMKDVCMSILRFESINFEGILWVYVVLFIGFGIALFKVLYSWGLPCLFTASATIGLGICLFNFWASLAMPWNWVGVGGLVFLLMLTWYFGKKTYSNPVIA